MIIGIDEGATATKIVLLEGDRLVFSRSYLSNEMNTCQMIQSTLEESGFSPCDVEKLAVTGVGAEKCTFESISVPVFNIPEIEATGEGGTWLSGLKDAVILSIGTGTSIVLAKNGQYRHIGGTGVGSGTLRGLSKKIFGAEDLLALFSLADKGNRYTVDITIGDLFSGTDTLHSDLTASNLAKASDGASDADWAKAMVNTVLEVAGSHAALACAGFGVKSVVITGGITVTRIAKEVYDNFQRLYNLRYIIPTNSAYATAIGAARLAGLKS